MKDANFHVIAKDGIHARPATTIVRAAGKYSSDIKIIYNDKSANAKSIMGIMTLGILTDSDIKVVADGADEDDAIEKLSVVLQDEGLIG